MTDQTDTSPDTPGDSSASSTAVTSADTPRYPDRFRGARWGRGGDDDEGSTWEQHQDEGTFPAWL